MTPGTLSQTLGRISFPADTEFLGAVGAIQVPPVLEGAKSSSRCSEITIPALGKSGTLILQGNKTIYGSSSKGLRVSQAAGSGNYLYIFFFCFFSAYSTWFLQHFLVLAMPWGLQAAGETEFDVKEKSRKGFSG